MRRRARAAGWHNHQGHARQVSKQVTQEPRPRPGPTLKVGEPEWGPAPLPAAPGAGGQPPGTHKHGGPVLEGTGQARVVGEAGVAVAGRQGGVQEGLLSRVVGLGLALLGLSQGGGRCGGRRVTSAELGDIT